MHERQLQFKLPLRHKYGCALFEGFLSKVGLRGTSKGSPPFSDRGRFVMPPRENPVNLCTFRFPKRSLQAYPGPTAPPSRKPFRKPSLKAALSRSSVEETPPRLDKGCRPHPSRRPGEGPAPVTCDPGNLSSLGAGLGRIEKRQNTHPGFMKSETSVAWHPLKNKLVKAVVLTQRVS